MLYRAVFLSMAIAYVLFGTVSASFNRLLYLLLKAPERENVSEYKGRQSRLTAVAVVPHCSRWTGSGHFIYRFDK